MDKDASILVVGATGATGRLLVEQLLERGQHVKAVVRSPGGLPKAVRNHPKLSIIKPSVLELSDEELSGHLRDCKAVVSCLGHNLSFRGVFGRPWRLVTDTSRRLCDSLKANRSSKQTKFVLMSSSGVRNRDIDESISLAQRFVIGLLYVCLPPHADHEDAADYFRTEIGQNDTSVEWVAVRPDGLIDLDRVTRYELHHSPTRSAIFDAGKTSRINVAHFMAGLLTDPVVWQKWKGRMPCIYNKAEPGSGASSAPSCSAG